ncbi:MAG: YaeQ family protein [Candidatus Omnitrophica bacterium]|nr:YaeQ family protein [Candidatus Omnitrophota bacterium]
MVEKFTFELHAPKINHKKIVLVKDEVELRNHVVLKLLAYVLFYDPELKVDVSADMHYQPDLIIPGDHGVPKLWIDCGKVTLKKVESLAAKLRHTRVIFVKETERELGIFKKLLEKKVEYFERLEYLAFDAGFVESVANALERTNHFTLYDVMENVIGIALNDQTFESTLFR